MNYLEGVIVKGISGFYYVSDGNNVVECKAKGVFRKMGMTPLVGDRVGVKLNDDLKSGVVTEVFPRQNVLVRPAVANVTQMMAVVALESPKPNLYILDKLIASAEYAGLKISICFNKSDLTQDKAIPDIYQKSGFRVVTVSACENYNIDKIKDILKNETTVFAGNSGVGKSTLLNLLMGKELFETGMVSNKTERGRHTTKHSQLEPLPFGGYIIDTPGFSSFELDQIEPKDLETLFREFGDCKGTCRFMDCAHIAEPDCKIRTAVKSGKIMPSRYESYQTLYDEIKNITYK